MAKSEKVATLNAKENAQKNVQVINNNAPATDAPAKDAPAKKSPTLVSPFCCM